MLGKLNIACSVKAVEPLAVGACLATADHQRWPWGKVVLFAGSAHRLFFPAVWTSHNPKVLQAVTELLGMLCLSYHGELNLSEAVNPN